MLGTNDAYPTTWNEEEYVRDLTELVRHYQSLPTAPVVYIATSPTFYGDSQQATTVNTVVCKLQKQVADSLGCTLIDIHTVTQDLGEHFPDNVHPDAEGYKIVAKAMAAAVTSSKTVNVTVSDTVVVAEAKKATTTVTIASDTEFVSGIFTVNAAEGLTLTGASVAADGWFVDCNTTNNRVLFQGRNDEDLNATTTKSLEILLTFDAKIEAGQEYAVSVDAIEVTNLAEDTYTVNATAGSVHIHKYPIEGETTGNVTVFKCLVCDAEKHVYEEVELGTNNLNDTASLNITFTNTGDLTLNFLNETKASYVAVLDDANKIDELISCGGTIEDLNAYQVPYTNGGVKSIADKVTVAFIIVDENGAIVSASDAYTTSIADYCKTVIDNSDKYDDADVDYCKALLNYGRAANDYFGYENSDLADLKPNDGYYDNYSTLVPTALNPLYKDGEAGWYFASANVIFENKPVVRLCVNIDKETYDAGELTLTAGIEGVMSTTVGMNELVPAGKANRYYIYLRNIPAKYFDSQITLTDNVDTDETYGYYSLETYAANKASSDIADLSRIMIAYGKALAQAF